MFGAILLTVLLLLGIPAGVYGTAFLLYLWGSNRRAGCMPGLCILLGAIVYIILWCYGLAEVIEMWREIL